MCGGDWGWLQPSGNNGPQHDHLPLMKGSPLASHLSEFLRSSANAHPPGSGKSGSSGRAGQAPISRPKSRHHHKELAVVRWRWALRDEPARRPVHHPTPDQAGDGVVHPDPPANQKKVFFAEPKQAAGLLYERLQVWRDIPLPIDPRGVHRAESCPVAEKCSGRAGPYDPHEGPREVAIQHGFFEGKGSSQFLLVCSLVGEFRVQVRERYGHLR